METRAGRDVDINVSMMHPMQAPKNGHVMKQAVLEIDRQVKQQERDRTFRPHRNRQTLKNPPMVGLSNKGETDCPGWSENSGYRRIQECHADVRWPTA